MTREQQLRTEWDARIPQDWDEILISDAHRCINRGRRQELISRSSLYRLAGAGEMGAFGGPGTGVQYRLRRLQLIDYLVRLEVTLSDRPVRERRRKAEVVPPQPAPAAVPARRRRARPTVAHQPSLFDPEHDDEDPELLLHGGL